MDPPQANLRGHIAGGEAQHFHKLLLPPIRVTHSQRCFSQVQAGCQMLWIEPKGFSILGDGRSVIPHPGQCVAQLDKGLDKGCVLHHRRL